MKILVIGDVHGSFDRMVMYQEEQDPDLCLQVGDLESVRNEEDLDELTGQEKYKEIKDFPPYWNGEKSVPVETLFIGGNHEPWSFLHQHDPTHGNDSYLIENLRYLGRSNVIELKGLTIAGLSGVYGPSSYEEPSNKRLKWAKENDWRCNKKLGHFRKDEVNKLIEDCDGRDIDILMTHCWPELTDFEETPEDLLRYGVEPVSELVELIQPTIHLCGHVHRPHQATIGKTDVYCPGKVSSEFEGDHLVLTYDQETFKPDSKWIEDR